MVRRVSRPLSAWKQKWSFPSISYYFHIPKNSLLLKKRGPTCFSWFQYLEPRRIGWHKGKGVQKWQFLHIFNYIAPFSVSFFYSWQLRKRHRKRCTWKYFWPKFDFWAWISPLFHLKSNSNLGADCYRMMKNFFRKFSSVLANSAQDVRRRMKIRKRIVTHKLLGKCPLRNFFFLV